MFGMGFTEILFIALIAFIFLGPEKLPDAMVKIARFFRDTKRMVNDARATFEDELNLKELKEEALHYRQSLEDTTRDISGFKNSIPNPAKEISNTIEEARRDFTPVSSDSLLEDIESSSPKVEEKPQKTQERPTEFKHLKSKKEQ